MEQDELAVELLAEMYEMLAKMRFAKNAGGPRAREWAIAVTELEKLSGFFAMRVVPSARLTELMAMGSLLTMD